MMVGSSEMLTYDQRCVLTDPASINDSDYKERDDTSTGTPGPIVEDTAIFLR